MVIEQFTHAVFLWISPDLRIERLKNRERERYGRIIDTDCERNRQFIAVIDRATGYDNNTTAGRTLKNHEEWMKALPCNVLQQRGDLSTEARVERITEALFAVIRLYSSRNDVRFARH